MNNLLKIASVDDRMNNDGKSYGIVFTCLKKIGNILKKKDFDYCIAAYDGVGSGVMRYSIYKEYKANRDKDYGSIASPKSEYDKKLEAITTSILRKSRERELSRGSYESEEESFDRQKIVLQQILEELCLRQYEFENVEGDDIIAYYVKNKLDNEKVVIVSSDKDLTQLISDTVIIFNPRLNEFVTKENCLEKVGMRCDNIVLEKMLCGDQSDNIKGIKGIGEQTLRKLFPEIMEEKLELDYVIERSNKLLEERRASKKKPLKALENIVNKVTDGSQGTDIYEINKKIIDLSTPLLTSEAKDEMDETMHFPMDTSDKNIGNAYKIISENRMNDLLDENRFGDALSPFSRIIMMEKRRFDGFKKSSN